MIQRAARPGRPLPRPSRLDLAQKTNLVPRAGFWRRGVGLALRTRSLRAAAFLWRIAGFLAAALVVDLQVAGGLRHPAALTGVELASLVLVGGLFAHRLTRRFRRLEREALPEQLRLEADLELAVLALVASRMVVGLAGGLGSPFEPIVYLAVVLLVVFHDAAVGAFAMAGAVALELLLAWTDGTLVARWPDLAAHAGFVVLFGAFYHLALGGSVLAGRRQTEAAIAAHRRELQRRAREYRLIVSSDAGDETAGETEREKWIAAAVGEVDKAVLSALELAEAALQTHTVALFLLSPDGRTLRLRECMTSADHLSSLPMAAGEGLPGVVLRRRGPVRLCGAFRGAIYYDGGESPKAFLGVPVVSSAEEGWVRGVLVADRLEERPFTDADEKVLTSVARDVFRAMEVERVMGYIRKEKDEKTRFAGAMETLNGLSTPPEICAAIGGFARQLAHLDFVAVTLTEQEGGALRHCIVEAVGPGAESLKGKVFDDNAGLVSKVVDLRSSLPAVPFHTMDRQVVFAPELKVRGLSTLKVLPLTVGDEAVGTLVCGSARKGALGANALHLLHMVCLQAGQAVGRARLFEQTQRMATTDGLTGLNNHRRFQELFEQVLAQARRYNRPVSMLLTDVDHFKSVNDTYGHPVGDLVLKGVSRVLATTARDTDIVARYGGEEFAVILPETDVDGAMIIADRIRQRISEQVFQTELGPLSVTISLGVAGCPKHGDHKQALVELADQALYAAKRGGRNRVVSADAL